MSGMPAWRRPNPVLASPRRADADARHQNERLIVTPARAACTRCAAMRTSRFWLPRGE
jgi:hypothetical protein